MCLANLVYADDIAIIPGLVGQIFQTGFHHEEILSTSNKIRPIKLSASHSEGIIDLKATCQIIANEKVEAPAKSFSSVLLLPRSKLSLWMNRL